MRGPDGMDKLILLGVRHHSPACARLVRRTIERVRPAFVLIEGPADFNPHIGDLRLAHTLPVAIFSYHASDAGSRTSYSPFCVYSPEWQALQAAWAAGATPLFCDLPAWHPEFGDRRNRYADPHGLHERYAAATSALQRELSADGADAAWDALVEQRDTAGLGPVLERYFDLVRPADSDDPREAGREAFMGRYAAWAVAAAGGRPVVLVCGGWHVNGIRAAARSADGIRPPTPVPDDGSRAGSYLTPYSYARLDSFTGYAAGMLSPAYYHQVFETGLAAAADWAVERITQALRDARLTVSTADRIAWQANTLALARLRGHSAPLRADILDAAVSSLVKDALPRPAEWSGAAATSRGSDDWVAIMLRALSVVDGSGIGRLAAGTRQPPLMADVESRMRAHSLSQDATRKRISIDWHKAEDRPRAYVLHQLGLLELPGISRSAGPEHADARVLEETFVVTRDIGWAGAVIEASRWGGELPLAAAARLEAAIHDANGDMDAVAAALSLALFAGLLEVRRELITALTASVTLCRDIGALGRAGCRMSRIYRYGDVFGAGVTAELAPVCKAVFTHVLWLSEGVRGNEQALAAIDAVVAVRDFARDGAGLALDLPSATDTFSRLLASTSTPPALAGAALGYLIATGAAAANSEGTVARVRGLGLPETLGDFLAGLFALARESLQEAGEALGTIDALLADWTDDEFLAALPSMRAAFAWFPPREREALARFILQRAGFDLAHAEAHALSWMRQRAPVLAQAEAMALEKRVVARLARYGFN